MDPLVATLFLVALALFGARFSFSTERIPAGPRLLFRTGAHFLFLGFLLGPPVLGLVSLEAINQLFPLLGLGLGWVGLLFGLQLDRETLSQFPASFHLIALGQAVLTFLLVLGAAAAWVIGAGIEGQPIWMMVAILAAVASVSTPAGIAMISSNFLARGKVRQFIFFVASLDGVVGIIALHLIYSRFEDLTGTLTVGVAPWWFWALGGLGLGIVCAVVFLWLGRLRPNREELVLYLLGISALSAGAALEVQLSPLFVGMVIGAVVTNLSPDGDRIFRTMEKWEKPIYLILLLLAGALLKFPTWLILPMGLAYAVVRALAKVIANAVLVSVIKLPFPTPRRLGLGLIAQGGISLAMVLSAVLTLTPAGFELWGYPAVDLLFSTVVLGVVLSELGGPLFTTALLRRAGEISPRVEEAIEEGDDAKAEEAAKELPSEPPPQSLEPEAP